ncbi:Hypothetical_protein [Hexamita inflata]|uniref:Hypothetical_protein n=1 Tax=Hexamita inflata TaxID=28002 RepID=A0AA86UJY2_9EUKA|nr:Hypothetical protein HINF_LOCUS46409 [Hexamita inflata]
MVYQENLKCISQAKSRVITTVQLQMAPKSKQVLLYVQQSVIAYQLNIADMKYQQALHDMEIQLILYCYTKSILQQVKVDIFSPTLINIWSEKLQIKIKSVYVKAQKSQLQLGSFQECLLKNRGAHTVPYLVKQDQLNSHQQLNKLINSLNSYSKSVTILIITDNVPIATKNITVLFSGPILISPILIESLYDIISVN